MSSDAIPLARVSRSILNTDPPCIVKMNAILAGAKDIQSLAQGVTHWAPPSSSLDAAAQAVRETASSRYGSVTGLPELTNLIKSKLSEENGLDNQGVMVTVGANQAFMNIALALCDPKDDVLLFKPYYFNHYMALQMTDVNVRFAPRMAETFEPDLDWLEANLSGVKMLVLVNPCNPSGALASMQTLKRLQELCHANGVWLVVDNTYEYFVYEDDLEHCAIQGSNVLNVFSFSKAYGLMGWRVGYIAYQSDQAELEASLLKVQDTIPICPCIVSQRAAIAAMHAGKQWVAPKVAGLKNNRQLVIDAIEELPDCTVLGACQGAIYAMVKLPVEDDMKVVEWLAHQHHVAVIPGSACGAPGHIRVAYANLSLLQCRQAVAQLVTGLRELSANPSIVA